MDHRIVWVHGIGDHAAGFSDAWRASLDQHLRLGIGAYVEVLWEPVLDGTSGRIERVDRTPVVARRPEAARERRLTPSEARAARRVEAELATILQARKVAAEQAGRPAPEAAERAGRAGPVLEWRPPSAAETERVAEGLATWLFNPTEYIGDFVTYLVSRPIRTAVKECFKERIRALAPAAPRIAVIAHSWGTVVAYDSLLDLADERPDARVSSFFTLGSPLWMVRRFLEVKTGRRPDNVDLWVNVTARGDLIGSWLRPAFAVDRDLQVPSVAGAEPHGSYFAAGNAAVQRDILADLIRRQ